MSKNTSSARADQTRREQLRAQQLADAKRARTRMRILYAVAGFMLIAIVATVGVVIYNDRQNKRDIAAREAASQVKPPHLNADGSGIVVNPQVTGDVPTLSVYLDFQCPACKSANDYFGATVNKLAADGKLKLEYRVLTFLDTNLRNDSSERAARASFCADIAGSFGAFHDAVYANQPAEGTGFTDEQLRVTYPTAAGITGAKLTAYQKCYDDKATAQAVRDEESKARTTWQGSTPQYSVNGKSPKVKNEKGEDTDWWRVLEPTEQSWVEAIDKIK
ncbi:DsbA family protein [Aestuariimicrobium kwangyangense]|uniref:DsbA family protein n=1 Tax=Aestuariimicrobium kwangyangense TaxID=396389 RepID=UPI0003B74154|nr:thioredoxin domain-containing protein [Aestuariimicrobium kwangyangense]